MRAIPYILIMAILVGGIFVAFQTLGGEPEEVEALAERPTVTPRPWPTSPPRPPSPTFAADPFGPDDVSRASVAPGQAAPPPSEVVPSPTLPPSAPVATATPPPVPSPTPTPEPTLASVRQATLRVGNTGGEGVYLRRTPRMDDRIRPWPDNTPMVVVGPRVEGDGHMWEKVRAPDGTEGYIPAEYLVGGP